MIGAERPGNRSLLVEGCRSYDKDTETFIPDWTETMKIVVCPLESLSEAEQHEPPNDGPPCDDDHDEGPGRPSVFFASGGEAGLHSPPCSMPAATVATLEGDSGRHRSCHKWNLSPAVDLALRSRRSEDTSVEQVKPGIESSPHDLCKEV